MYFVTDYETELDHNLEDSDSFDNKEYFDDSFSAESNESKIHKSTSSVLPKSSIKSLPSLNQYNQKKESNSIILVKR